MANLQAKGEPELMEDNLSFVQRNPMLKQVLIRDPKDNLFPRVKAFYEYEPDDMKDLMKQENRDQIIQQIISCQNTKPNVLKGLLKVFFDSDFCLSKQIYDRLKGLGECDQSVYNQLAWSAAHFDQDETLDKLLTESEHKVDLQVYIKCVLKQVKDFSDADSRTPDYLKNLYEAERVSERHYKFAQSVLKESLNGQQNSGSKSKKERSSRPRRRVRRNSDDEPVDVEYQEMQAKWDSIVDDMQGKVFPNDYGQEKQLVRNEAYRESISKASSKLKTLNEKNQSSQAEIDIEQKHFEVLRDPLDGNIYLHIEPQDLDKYSSDDIKRISEQFQKHVKAEMPVGEYENLQKSKLMETEKTWKQIMEEKSNKDHETDPDHSNSGGNK